MIQIAPFGVITLYRRRLAVATRSASDIIGQLATPVLWMLVLGPALDAALGDLSPAADSPFRDYFTYIAVAQVAFLVPFVSMFSGINEIVDMDRGILREFLVAPVARAAIPLANAFGVLTIALVQVAVLVGLAIARGAQLDTSVTGVLWFLGGTALLSLSTYGLAATLALTIRRQEAYGPMIPAVGVTPWFLAGSLFPITALPTGIEQIALVLPWTHALALMRYGLTEGTNSGLADIWHMDSDVLMAALSMAVLAVYTIGLLGLAVRVFYRKTMA